MTPYLRAFLCLTSAICSVASLFCLFTGQIGAGLVVLLAAFVLMGAGIAYGLEPLDVETKLGQAE